MCNGSIMDKLISFALPLMLSGILQLMFNAVDIIVVGHFTGKQALAAVGSTTALINVFTNLFIGISLGANVLAARFFASGREKEMSDTVHTAILLALISGILMAGIGVISAKGALLLMGTPDNVIAQSTLYMRIYFLGMPFFMLYNYGAAILRAVGDTKRPLLFLVISGCANALLDLILVIGSECFHGDSKFHSCISVGAYKLVVIQFDDISLIFSDDAGYSYELTWLVRDEDGDSEDSVSLDETVLYNGGHGDDVHVSTT